MKTLIMAATVICFLVLSPSTRAAAKKQTFYGCERGFQYESKKNAARCIKQQKLTFRPPLKCQHKQKSSLKFRLVVDSDGTRDLCEAIVTKAGGTNKKPSHLSANQRELRFPPLCMTGYKLKARKGKDACAKGNPEQIKPPTKKVRR